MLLVGLATCCCCCFCCCFCCGTLRPSQEEDIYRHAAEEFQDVRVTRVIIPLIASYLNIQPVLRSLFSFACRMKSLQMKRPFWAARSPLIRAAVRSMHTARWARPLQATASASMRRLRSTRPTTDRLPIHPHV